ncbi:hypothetical protein [Streptomyces sp. NPDC053048]|uniref:hypothetical protein n=1 Tax=Streptomyces sp. NPDC053048 TaxID=3365694 RepID=UPI0037CF4525
MFEIRIICDDTDTDQITKTLSGAFATGSVRQHPTRDGKRMRLYVTADHHEHPADDPYAKAPSLLREMADVMDLALQLGQDEEPFPPLEREHRLRKAAMLDRIALQEAATYPPDVAANAAEAAEVAAITLALTDGDKHANDLRVCAWTSYRDYVRQEYATWLRENRH